MKARKSKLKSGLSVPGVIAEIVLMIMLVVVLVMIIQKIPSLSSNLPNFFQMLFSQWSPSGTPIDYAILCSYQRCSEGCENVVDEGKWFYNGVEVSCSEFCKHKDFFDIDGDGKICGREADVYPVEVDWDTNIYGSELNEHSGFLKRTFHCVLSDISDDWKVRRGDVAKAVVFPRDRIIVKEKDKDCGKYGLKSFELQYPSNPIKKYFISSSLVLPNVEIPWWCAVSPPTCGVYMYVTMSAPTYWSEVYENLYPLLEKEKVKPGIIRCTSIENEELLGLSEKKSFSNGVNYINIHRFLVWDKNDNKIIGDYGIKISAPLYDKPENGVTIRLHIRDLTNNKDVKREIYVSNSPSDFCGVDYGVNLCIDGIHLERKTEDGSKYYVVIADKVRYCEQCHEKKPTSNIIKLSKGKTSSVNIKVCGIPDYSDCSYDIVDDNGNVIVRNFRIFKTTIESGEERGSYISISYNCSDETIPNKIKQKSVEHVSMELFRRALSDNKPYGFFCEYHEAGNYIGKCFFKVNPISPRYERDAITICYGNLDVTIYSNTILKDGKIKVSFKLLDNRKTCPNYSKEDCNNNYCVYGDMRFRYYYQDYCLDVSAIDNKQYECTYWEDEPTFYLCKEY